MTLLGELGLKKLAKLNHAKAVQLSKALAEIEGVEVINQSFFNEFTIRLSKPAEPIVEALASKNILAGVPASRLWPDQKPLDNLLMLAATETVSDAHIEELCTGLKEVLDA